MTLLGVPAGRSGRRELLHYFSCVFCLFLQEGVDAAGASTMVGASRGGASVPEASTASGASMVSAFWCFIFF